MKRFFEKYPAMKLFIALFILMCAAYFGYMAWYNGKNAKNQKLYDDLKEDAWVDNREDTVSSNEAISKDDALSDDTPKKTDLELFLEDAKRLDLYEPYLYKTIDFSQYLEINDDVIGYLVIPDTDIEYPVLRHPDKDRYYLKHNLDKSSGYPGCLFVENYNKADFEDAVTVIYGHNMRNDTMFGTLDVYKDSDFRESHPYFMVYQIDGSLNVYEVSICTEYSTDHLLKENFQKIDGDWYFTGMTEHDQTDLYAKLKAYNAEDCYVSSIGFTSMDRCVALATCSGKKRFVVVGKRVFKSH